MSDAEKPLPRARPIRDEERPKSKMPLIVAGVAGSFLLLCLGCCGIFAIIPRQPNVNANRLSTNNSDQAKNDSQPVMEGSRKEATQPEQPVDKSGHMANEQPPTGAEKRTFSQTEVARLTDPGGNGGGAVAGNDIIRMLGKPDRVGNDKDGGKVWIYHDKVRSDKDGHVYRTTVIYINKVGYCNLPAINTDIR